MLKLIKERFRWILLMVISIVGFFLIFLVKQNNILMEDYSNKDFGIRQTQRVANQIRAQLYRAAFFCHLAQQETDATKKEELKDQCLGALEGGFGQLNTQNPFEKAKNVSEELDKFYHFAESDQPITTEMTQKLFEVLGAEESYQWQLSTANYQFLKDNFSNTNFLLKLAAIFILFISGLLAVLIFKKEKTDQALITAHEEIESQRSQLVQSGKMSALGEMASGIAHEINNPMAVIEGKSANIIKLLEKPEIDKPKIIQNAEKIISMSDRITKIVKGLRSFSRDGSKDPFQSSNVFNLIDETFELCQAKLKNRNVRLENKFTNKALKLNCRNVELSQVLLNLIHNATDAISNDNSKTEKWITVNVIESENWIEFQVTDSGKGIPLNIQQKLFQPFFTTKELGKGTGLGLSISRGIILSHKGEMGIDNECPNTRFYFKIPKDLPDYTNNAEATSNVTSAIIKDSDKDLEAHLTDKDKATTTNNKKSVA